MGGAAALCEFQISSGPLLHQCCGKCTDQAEDQAEEPQHVHSDGRSCWFERLVTLGYEALEWCPVGNVDELLRYLS
jgi:hypothetical protein